MAAKMHNVQTTLKGNFLLYYTSTCIKYVNGKQIDQKKLFKINFKEKNSIIIL